MLTILLLIIFLFLWIRFDFVEAFGGTILVGVILTAAYEFLQENMFFVTSVITISIILIGVFSAKAAQSKKESATAERELASKIKHFTKQEFINGFNITKDFGWVRAKGEKTREQVEKTLKARAARYGANAVMKFSWQSERETYQAGRSKRGNPYYKNRTVYNGEAVAVLLQASGKSRENTASKVVKLTEEQTSFNKKPTFKKYLGKKIVLDGNNIVGCSDWSFQPLTLFMEKLAETNYEYTLFFDNNIYRALKESNLILKDETIPKSISRVTGIEERCIVVTPAGVEADSFILELAVQQKSAVISNDRYADFKETYPSVFDDYLLKFELVGGTILVPKLNFNA